MELTVGAALVLCALVCAGSAAYCAWHVLTGCPGIKVHVAGAKLHASVQELMQHVTEQAERAAESHRRAASERAVAERAVRRREQLQEQAPPAPALAPTLPPLNGGEGGDHAYMPPDQLAAWLRGASD